MYKRIYVKSIARLVLLSSPSHMIKLLPQINPTFLAREIIATMPVKYNMSKNIGTL